MNSSGPTYNVWWGIGFSVEGQVVAVGVNSMVAMMRPLGMPGNPALIRIDGIQAGLGLGGSADLTLVIATGIASPAAFQQVSLDGGWDPSFHLAFRNHTLAQKIKGVPVREIMNFAEKNPSYVNKLNDEIMLFFKSLNIDVDAAFRNPKLYTFKPKGFGYQISIAYHWSNKAVLL